MLECGMTGHLDPDRRRGLFVALLPRLAPGAPVVFNVQPPAAATEPVQVDPYTVRVGGLEYEGRGHAQPVAADRLRWTMTYRTMLDGAEIARATAEYDWWRLSASGSSMNYLDPGPTPSRLMTISSSPTPPLERHSPRSSPPMGPCSS
jgi:hypothetical protein